MTSETVLKIGIALIASGIIVVIISMIWELW